MLILLMFNYSFLMLQFQYESAGAFRHQPLCIYYYKVPIKSVSTLIVLVQTKLCNDGLMSMCMHVLWCLKRCFKCVIKGCSQELAGQANLALNATSEKPLPGILLAVKWNCCIFSNMHCNTIFKLIVNWLVQPYEYNL